MKRKLLAVITSVLCFAAAIPPISAAADGQKVVTLGADLSEEQKQAILRYFGVAGQNLQTLTITNQDERDHLGAYVPLEQIGSRTYSCALVSPTTSGGIQVKTANLSWVTSNMIASTLSTSGVVNCDVLAAAPFEVSGTGALTGIMMAYESAVGQTLDSAKKEVATQELITTTQIANNVGQINATEIVNESKMQVIEGNVVNADDIDVIINQIAQEENISLSDEDRELLSELLAQIAEQNYDYEEMKETLERVEANMAELTAEEDEPDEPLVIDGGTTETEAPPQTEALDDDSILLNTDDSALGESVIFDATDDAALAETEAASANNDPADFDITSSDSYGDEIEDVPSIDEGTENPELSDEPAGTVSEENPDETGADVSVEFTGEEEPPADELDTLTEDGDELTDGSEDMELPADDGAVTLNLELLPLSDFVLAPITSESTGYEVFQAGTTELTISFQRNDIIGGSGTLTLYNAADSSIVETIQMNDASKVAIKPLNDEELTELGWTEGNKAVVYLSSPLAQNSSYFVSLSEDALSTQDGIGHSEATQDNYTWCIQTGAYGFGIPQTAAGITAGSPVSAQILMSGTQAVYACIENADTSVVNSDAWEYWESGSFNMTFTQPGTTSFQVSFYDEAGSLLYTIDYQVEVK